ncbi:TetR/AcrR family transcriptional regulator [Tsukamurella soli]|uniref:TetR/AcrR family transcriptional regulator n=1 Tax=Tsukamurella soli TaxID=644556 RepID=A0ABP8JVB5_9ACTN
MTARDDLVKAAIDLIRRHGVAGTGLSELTDRSGRSRRTIYLNFPGGKSELVTEAARVAGAAISALIDAVPVGAAPVEVLDALIEWWRRTLTANGFEAGCPVVAAALGRSEAPAAAAAAGLAFGEWERILAGRIGAAGVTEDVATALASTAIAAIEGAVVMCSASGTTAPLDRVAGQLRILVEAQSRPGVS